MTNKNSIPESGVEPVNYTGRGIISDIARALGRQLTIEEVKLLVVPDGNVIKCAYTGKEFQPVRFVLGRNTGWEDVLQKIAEANDLAKVVDQLQFRGCYFLNGLDEIIAFSRGRFQKGGTEYDRYSHLNEAMSRLNVSGKTYKFVSTVQGKRIENDLKWKQIRNGRPSHNNRAEEKARRSRPRYDNWAKYRGC